MTNAKKESERLLEERAKAKCAPIIRDYPYDDGERYPKFELKVNHTEEEFESFLKSLDFDYNRLWYNQRH